MSAFFDSMKPGDPVAFFSRVTGQVLSGIVDSHAGEFVYVSYEDEYGKGLQMVHPQNLWEDLETAKTAVTNRERLRDLASFQDAITASGVTPVATDKGYQVTLEGDMREITSVLKWWVRVAKMAPGDGE